jgi:hypothetical protein
MLTQIPTLQTFALEARCPDCGQIHELFFQLESKIDVIDTKLLSNKTILRPFEFLGVRIYYPFFVNATLTFLN